LARIPLVWALSATFATSSTMAYVSFAWLPSVFIDIGGVDAATAGLLLSLFAAIGLPASLLVPMLVVRMQATRPLVLVGSIGGLAGLAGLILAPVPGLLPLWTVLFGLNGVLFPLALVLISIRARTPETAVVLSSFVQSIGYTLAAVFPVLFGVLHAVSGSWTWSLLMLGAVLIAVIPAGMIAGRRRTIEDEWESRHGAW
jgi:CP family cyanate transporter-like MFS transporter